MKWAVPCVLLLGLSAAQDFPAYWKKQKVEFRSCPAGAEAHAYFNDLTKYFDAAGHLRALEFKATHVYDAYFTVTFEYSPAGDLRRVNSHSMGFLDGASSDTEWLIRSGRVVAATVSSSLAPADHSMGRPDFSKFKTYSHPIPLGSIPPLYLGKPTPEWMQKVACSHD